MANTEEKRPLVHRQSEVMHPFSDHKDGQTVDMEQKQISANPALTVVFQKYELCTKSLRDPIKRKAGYFAEMGRELEKFVGYSFTNFTDEEDRKLLSSRLVTVGFVESVIEYYTLVLDELGISAVTLDFMTSVSPDEKQQSGIVYKIREILWNFSDSNNSFSEAIAKTDLFEKLASDLDAMAEDGMDRLDNTEEIFPFNSAVGIIHNCARNPSIDKGIFRNIGIVGSLIPFLKSKNLYVKMITILALGNIIKENEVQTLDADTDIFDFILTAMKQASYSKHRKEYGFHISELCDGLASLAKSDQNKHLIMEKDPLRLVKDLLRGHNIAEILAAIKLVWELAFLESNKVLISRDKEILMAIDSLRKNKNEGISLAATKAWFVLAGKDGKLRDDESSAGAPILRGKHVMMSYHAADKDVVHKIYEELKAKGYPLWIDTAEAGKFDSIVDAMIYGVDNAYVILVCFSEKYKNSQNCRTEADFAFTRRKEIIPLKMQRGYNPDGWLGALIGARFFVEFSPQKPFDKQIAGTIQQLEKYKVSEKDSRNSSFKPEIPRDHEAANLGLLRHGQSFSARARPPSMITRKVKDWEKHDIEHWAKENKIMGYAFKRITMLTGEQLYFVYTLLVKNPDTFYKWAETKLRLGSIEDLMRFHDALKCLVTHV